MSDLGGDPACLLGEMCPTCGAVPDPAHGHGCPACAPVAFADVVAAGSAAAATRARTTKTDVLAALFARTTPGDLPVVIGFLTGTPRQGRIGVGWSAAFGVDVEPAAVPSLTVADVDAAITALAGVGGPGSQAERDTILRALFGRATAEEAGYLRRLFVGELRHGALAGVVTDAVAKAFRIEPAAVRRAAMLLGDLGETAVLARRGPAALADVQLVVGRPVQPMLASPAADLDAALAATLADGVAVSVEWKLDGIRVQVHKRGDDIRVFTRNLNDITDRVPEVVAASRTVEAQSAVLDGEAMAWTPDGTPVAFQHTASMVGRTERVSGAPTGAPVDDATETTWDAALRPFFFDCLHHDGVDLLDEPLARRRDVLRTIAGPLCIPGTVTADPEVAASVAHDALAAGHEGVVVKDLRAPYKAGRRGSAWRKVKPVRTFDLVVLAAEWGHGRRTGWLSNLHLGARDEHGGFVMVGKTFKGLTDALLAWQTERFLELEVRRTASTVHVRPEQVVEIAIDGVQISKRYPGAVALRFARVLRYRDDKTPAEADTIDALQALLPEG
jgi:DNA ligase-1